MSGDLWLCCFFAGAVSAVLAGGSVWIECRDRLQRLDRRVRVLDREVLDLGATVQALCERVAALDVDDEDDGGGHAEPLPAPGPAAPSPAGAFDVWAA